MWASTCWTWWIMYIHSCSTPKYMFSSSPKCFIILAKSGVMTPVLMSWWASKQLRGAWRWCQRPVEVGTTQCNYLHTTSINARFIHSNLKLSQIKYWTWDKFPLGILFFIPLLCTMVVLNWWHTCDHWALLGQLRIINLDRRWRNNKSWLRHDGPR